MQRLLCDGWRFALLPPEGDPAEAAWRPVSLPHDWLISQADSLYQDGDGWYERELEAGADWLRRDVRLRFDGVYMDCQVWLNGVPAAAHPYGYTAFDVPLTGLREGKNLLRVLVRHRSPNSRWYSGAGIFRDVTLYVEPRRRVVPDGLYITPERCADSRWQVRVEAELTGPDGGEALLCRLTDAAGREVAEASVPAQGDRAELLLPVPGPRLWSPEDPYLYSLTCALGEQTLSCRVGLRTVELTTDRGLLLNGQRVKLRGVCLHHDLGCLGAAFHEKAARRQLTLMQRMGANALRTSHNPPAKQVMDLCDELGILVCSEAFDMWERPKNRFDYARFFPAWAEADVAAWVRRDRNHPSLILWSVGNEIFDTNAGPRGEEITGMLKALVERHDPRGHGRPTIGSNYMPWEGAQRCADVLKVAGYNYGEKYYAPHRAAHPDWVIYGSETGSVLQSRGVFHFPLAQPILSEEDLQCSDLGNSLTSWGTRDLRAMLAEEEERDWTLGQFLWSGVDYIGEPTPYHTRCCYFGQADTACFPKESFYQVQALWSPSPMCRVGVTWDWNPGQMIDVPVMTNAPEAELRLNGVSLGRRKVERGRALWQVPFAPGEITATALDASGKAVAAHTRRTSGDSAALALSAQDGALRADGHDLTFVTVSALDKNGIPVQNACDRVHVTVTGAALLGLDNGDSTDPDGYATDCRRLFGGKLLIVLGGATAPGTARVRVTAPGLEPAELALPVTEAAPVPGRQAPAGVPASPAPCLPREARRVDIRPEEPGPVCLTPERPEALFRVTLLPQGCMAQEPAFRVVNAAGIDSPCAKAEPVPGGVRVTGRGDGLVYLRCSVTNGDSHPRVLSQMEVRLSGFGSPCLDPYGFVAGGLCDLRDGDIGSGNEQGIAFSRDGYSMAGFSNVDFGPAGSDEITLPVFALDSEPYEISLWRGDPRRGGSLVAVLPYQKPSRWNVYQAETWRLPVRFRGVETVCFSMTKKIHLKGFSFTRQSRAWQRLSALEADSVYGDSFTREETGIHGIGNNVTLTFAGMDFGAGGAVELTICGRTPLEMNPVNVRFTGPDGAQTTQMCAFRGTERGEQTFTLQAPEGLCQVAFLFLPGCQFDFDSFQFRRL